MPCGFGGCRRGDLDESGEGGVGRRGFAPADDEAAFGSGAFERTENDFGWKMLGFGRCHERCTETGADKTDGVGAGPDLFGDARGESGAVEGGEDAVVVAGIVRAGKDDERRGGEIAELKMRTRSERVIGGEQDAVAFAKQETRVKMGRGSVGVEKSAGEVAGFERGELDGGGGLVELDANAGEALVEFAQDSGEDGGHREAGEGDTDVSDLAGGERFDFVGDRSEGAQQRFGAIEQQATGGSDFDAAARAIEEIGVEGGFELGDGAAERGLGDGERFGGFAKVELSGDLAEVDEVAELEG